MAEPRKFTKTINGEEIVQYAALPADAVQFEYDGWHEVKDTAPVAETVAEPVAEEPAKPGGKRTPPPAAAAGQ